MSHEVSFFQPPQCPTGGTVYVRPSLEEDEVLIEWLKSNYPTLSRAERRSTVQRLVNEFDHTATGIAQAIGVTRSVVYKLAVPEETARRWEANTRRRVPVTRIARFAEEWRERASRGLSPAEALQLLDEMRALGPKPVDAKEDVSAEGR